MIAAHWERRNQNQSKEKHIEKNYSFFRELTYRSPNHKPSHTIQGGLQMIEETRTHEVAGVTVEKSATRFIVSSQSRTI